MKKNLEIVVKGKVQGVFYRASTEEEAQKLKLSGYVKNLPNGNVFIEAEGEEEDLKKLVEWCKKGPSRAKVDSLEIKDGSVKNYQVFEVKR